MDYPDTYYSGTPESIWESDFILILIVVAVLSVGFFFLMWFGERKFGGSRWFTIMKALLPSPREHYDSGSYDHGVSSDDGD
jgi:hypothetical protein